MELPKRESLKRQIDAVKREIERREQALETYRKAVDERKPRLYGFKARLAVADEQERMEDLIDEMQEVLATLEGLMVLAY